MLACYSWQLLPQLVQTLHHYGLEIGKATVADAEKMYRIEKIGLSKDLNGTMYNVSANQVNFEGLEELALVFDEKGALSVVTARLPKSRFKSLHQSLSKKYKVVKQEIPFVGDSFVIYINGSTKIILDAPHLSFDMTMLYIDKDNFAAIEAKLKEDTAAKKKSQEDRL